jgi:hypothetical protein
MSSYHGADTAKIMDDMRRQTKRKQAKGTGTRQQTTQPVDHKEMSRNVPRHFDAILDAALVNDICFWANANNRTVTCGMFRRWFMSNMHLDDSDTKDKVLLVTLCGENAKIMNGDGIKIKIAANGFFMEDGSTPPVQIWSITFRMGNLDIVGFQAKWDNVRNQMFIN